MHTPKMYKYVLTPTKITTYERKKKRYENDQANKRKTTNNFQFCWQNSFKTRMFLKEK